MKFLVQWQSVCVLTIMVTTAVAVSCSRGYSVPSTAALNTPTPVSSVVTNTATCTATNTVTNTVCTGCTLTNTGTDTKTATITSTATTTNTVTSTTTVQYTNTTTNTVTNTPTATVTNTITATKTYTNTATNTATSTPTATSGTGPKQLSAAVTVSDSSSYFMDPTGIAYYGGYVWIANQDGADLQKWVTNGSSPAQTLSSYGSSIGFGGVNENAVDSKTGNVYLADEGNSVVCVFSSSGTYLAVFGSGTLSQPYGVVINSAGTKVYVSDATNNAIYAFAIGGSPSSPTYGAASAFSGSGSAALNAPQGLAVDGGGNVWVTDTGDGLLKEFTASGGYSQSVTCALGSNPFYPTGLCFDSSGYIYATDGNNQDIVEFTAAGVASKTAGGLESPADITTDNAGNFYVVDGAIGTFGGFVWFH